MNNDFLKQHKDNYKNTVKNIILLTQNSGKTLEEIGVSKGRAWHIKQDWKNFPAARLQMLLQFLVLLEPKYRLNYHLASFP